MITITLWTLVLRKVKELLTGTIDSMLQTWVTWPYMGERISHYYSDTALVYLTMLSTGQTALNNLMTSEQRITWKDMVII